MANTTGGTIVWNLDVDNSGFTRGMENARSTANEVAKSIEDRLKNLGSSFESIGKDLSLRLSAPIIGLAGMGVKVAADLETMEQGFITLLGSTEEANEAINMIKRDAAKTPFEITGLVQSNQLLTAVTEDAQRSERMLLNVGKALTAMGKGQPELDRIIVNLQQIGAVGKASAIDIKQFAFAGIPIYKMLQEELGKTGEEIQQMVSDGEISFETLEKMFNKAGEGSGRFAQAFELQGGTFNQVLSNFKDNVDITLADIAQDTGLFDTIKILLTELTKAIATFGEIVKTIPAPIKSFTVGLLGVVATIGPLLLIMGNLLIVSSSAVKGFKLLAGVGPKVVSAIGLINKAFLILMANPIVLIIAAVIAVIALLAYVIYKNWDKITEATGKLIDFFKVAWDGFMQVLTDVASFIWEIMQAIAIPYIWLYETIIEPILLLIQAIFLRIFYEIYQFVVNVFINPLKKSIQDGLNYIKKVFSNIWNAVSNTTRELWNKIYSYIRGPIESAKSTISSVFGWINNFVTNTWNSIYNFINNMVSKIFNAIVSPFESAKRKIEEIGQKIRDAANAINPFERHSPSLVDNVRSGLDIIKKEYASLKNIQLPSIMSTSANVAEPAYAIAGNSMGYMGNNGINQDININIERVENKEDIDAIGRELGFRAKLML